MRRLLLPLCALALLASCRPENLRPVPPPGARADVFDQSAAQRIDVLWVVDNSGSMAPRQENLARNFRSFIERFQASNVDFRLAVTTTDTMRDQGRLLGNPAVLTPQTPGLTDAFSRNIVVGTDGSPYETGMEAARMALDALLESNQPTYDAIAACQSACEGGEALVECREGCVRDNPVEFLRPDAFLYVVFVTDDEDKSTWDERYYYRYFETAKGPGNDGMVTTAAIIDTGDSSTCGVAEGRRYRQLTALTGGVVGDICDEEFASSLQAIADNAVGLRRKFALGVTPEPTSLKVYARFRCDAPDTQLTACTEVVRTECEGEAADKLGLRCTVRQGEPDGWVYEEANNLIYFAGSSVPNVPSQVEVEYFQKEEQ
jgi:hypothetical protein